MRKIEFAFQVFGLLTLFPLYFVLEMSHGQLVLPELPVINVSASAETEKEIATPDKINENIYILFPLDVSPTYTGRTH